MAKTATTRRKRDPQESRERLLAAAIDAFALHGPKAATIDAICDAAGLNKRMAYHYFGSKDALYAEALRAVYDQFLSVEVELGSMLLPAEELLETLVRRYYEFLRDHPTFVRLICHENLNEGRVASKLSLAGLKAPVITALTLALQKGQADGRFRKGIDVTELLVSIFALCFFYFSNRHTMQQFLGRRPTGRTGFEKRVQHVVDLLLHGIAE